MNLSSFSFCFAQRCRMTSRTNLTRRARLSNECVLNSMVNNIYFFDSIDFDFTFAIFQRKLLRLKLIRQRNKQNWYQLLFCYDVFNNTRFQNRLTAAARFSFFVSFLFVCLFVFSISIQLNSSSLVPNMIDCESHGKIRKDLTKQTMK